MEEDPSVFDYDGVYDEMKEKIARPKLEDKSERVVSVFFCHVLMTFALIFYLNIYENLCFSYWTD